MDSNPLSHQSMSAAYGLSPAAPGPRRCESPPPWHRQGIEEDPRPSLWAIPRAWCVGDPRQQRDRLAHTQQTWRSTRLRPAGPDRWPGGSVRGPGPGCKMAAPRASPAVVSSVSFPPHPMVSRGPQRYLVCAASHNRCASAPESATAALCRFAPPGGRARWQPSRCRRGGIASASRRPRSVAHSLP